MEKVRKGVFETNSSSMHSITIADEGIYDHIFVPENGTLNITARGEYGWEQERYDSVADKLDYACILCEGNARFSKMLIKVIKKHTGAKEVNISYDDGYIDHQSMGLGDDIFYSEEATKNFIFNPNSELETGNDNY